MHSGGINIYAFQDDEDGEYTSSEYFEKTLQQIRCAYISGEDSIALPEKYINGGNKVAVAGFTYGGATSKAAINGEKIRRAWWTVTSSNAQNITNIQNPTIEPNKGKIVFGNFTISVPVPVYDVNNGITPFEHFKNYLLPTAQTVEDDFNHIWESEIAQVINTNQSLTNKHVEQLKRIASCGVHLLASSSKYKLLKALLNVGWITNEKEEDLILDIIANTQQGEQAKTLFEAINNDAVLQEALMSSLDDFGGEEANFTRLGKELLQLFEKAYTLDEREQLYANLKASNNAEQEQLHYFYGFNDVEFCKWRISTSRENKRFVFNETHAYNVKYPIYSPLQAGSSLPTCDTKIENYSLPYSGVVAVHFPEGEFNGNLSQGGIVLMPALTYYVFIRAHYNENLRVFAEGLFFTAGILTPIDEFYLIGKALQYSNRGFKALRFSQVKLLAKAKRIKVSLKTAKGKKVQTLAENRVDDYVEFVEDFANGVDDLFSSFTNLKNLSPDFKTFLSAKN